jgi:hypothetical protein
MPRKRKTPEPFDLVIALAVRAFGQGFAAGAHPLRSMRGHTVEPATHEHWRRGFEEGRTAIGRAELRYGRLLTQRPLDGPASKRSRRP